MQIFQKGFNFSQDGPGNRLVYHIAGCNMRCLWCSNPEGMQESDAHTTYTKDALVAEAICCKPLFFDGGGVTFTGGEATLHAQELIDAIKNNFEGYEELRSFLLSCPKFGNNIAEVDDEAREIALRVSKMLRERKNYLGNPFRPDFSSPSTHLTYGYWVGATPDGRESRGILGYGVDPLYGEASNDLGFRMLSNMKLPFEEFNGGYASHLGIDPKYFKGQDYYEKGEEFHKHIIDPLFFNEMKEGVSPFYLYVNVATPETLRKLLANPAKYAPSGVYIMRIHGTFVNFLDLSPTIQEDIIKRLDLHSTSLC